MVLLEACESLRRRGASAAALALRAWTAAALCGRCDMVSKRGGLKCGKKGDQAGSKSPVWHGRWELNGQEIWKPLLFVAHQRLKKRREEMGVEGRDEVKIICRSVRAPSQRERSSNTGKSTEVHLRSPSVRCSRRRNLDPIPRPGPET